MRLASFLVAVTAVACATSPNAAHQAPPARALALGPSPACERQLSIEVRNPSNDQVLVVGYTDDGKSRRFDRMLLPRETYRYAVDSTMHLVSVRAATIRDDHPPPGARPFPSYDVDVKPRWVCE